VAFTVTTAGDDQPVTIDHADASVAVVEEGHLVLRGTRGIVGIYAPGRWAHVVESRGEPTLGRRVALPTRTA
jgi:hypothetical protein